MEERERLKALVFSSDLVECHAVKQCLAGCEEIALDIMEASTEQELQKKIDLDRFDLTLWNLQHPSQLKLIKFLKHKQPQNLIFLISSKIDKELAAKAFEHGADDFLDLTYLQTEVLSLKLKSLLG